MVHYLFSKKKSIVVGLGTGEESLMSIKFQDIFNKYIQCWEEQIQWWEDRNLVAITHKWKETNWAVLISATDNLNTTCKEIVQQFTAAKLRKKGRVVGPVVVVVQGQLPGSKGGPRGRGVFRVSNHTASLTWNPMFYSWSVDSLVARGHAGQP